MTEIDTYNDFIAETLAPRAVARPAARQNIDLTHWAKEFADVYRVSDALAKTPFVPKEMMGKTADVAAAIMKGRELGLDPFDALGSVYVVHGRVGFYAEFMRRRIIAAGHKLRIVESTDNRCVIEGRRKGDPDEEKVRVTYTVEQAKKSGINLGNYPADKLVARATSRICRQHFPDVLAGSLIAEDLIDGLVPTGAEPAAPEPAAAAAPAIARKRPAKKAAAASTQPPAAPPKTSAPDDELAELLGDEPADTITAEPEPEIADEPLPAEVQGEPDEDVVEAEVVADGITPQQLKKLSIMLGEAGFTDRETRHAFVQTAIDRQIGSAKDLTEDEATKVINILADSKPVE